MQLSRFWSSLSFCGAGFGLFAAQSVFMGSEKFYHEWLMPVVHILVRDAELTHLLGVKLTSFGIGYRKFPSASDERLIQAKRDKLSRKVFGLDFVHPVGIAAGFDKNGEAILNLLEAGFSHVEVGTVTPKPQDGNPKPRLFRFTTKMALVNRFGFNSEGHDAVYARLKDKPWKGKGVIGVNLGCNKSSADPILDYVLGVERFGDIADYLVINVSSPNTPGLRNLQRKEELVPLLTQVLRARSRLTNKTVPILLKISPDESDENLQAIAQVATDSLTRVDGLIVSNTALVSQEVAEVCGATAGLVPTVGTVYGGISGPPLRAPSTACLARLHQLTQASRLPLIGVGGVDSGEAAAEKLAAGASLVQLYTGIAYHGLPLARKVVRELAEQI